MTPDWGGRGLAVDGFNALPRSPGEWLRACHPSLALRPTFSFSTSLRHREVRFDNVVSQRPTGAARLLGCT